MLPALAFSIASLFTALWVVGLLIEDALINIETKTIRVNFQEFELAQTRHHGTMFLQDAFDLKGVTFYDWL